RLADMHHQRQAGDLGDALGDAHGCDSPGTNDNSTCPDLYPAHHVAVAFYHVERPVNIDRAFVDQLRHAVAGDEPDGTDVDEGLDGLALPLDDVFAQAMEGRLAGGARIGHGGNTALQAGLV